MKHTFLANSSSGKPYDVVFEVIGNHMTIRCSCKAGELAQQCKHKRALASGDGKMLFDQSQSQALDELMAMPAARDLMARLKVEEEALAVLDNEKTRLASEEKVIKRRIGDLFVGRA